MMLVWMKKIENCHIWKMLRCVFISVKQSVCYARRWKIRIFDVCSVTMASWFVKHSIHHQPSTFLCGNKMANTLLHYAVVFLNAWHIWCCFFNASTIYFLTHTKKLASVSGLTLGVNNITIKIHTHTIRYICSIWICKHIVWEK